MNAFKEIIGYESIKQELMQIADILKNGEVYKALGVDSPRGLMLYGKPGVGKTTMADALIKESCRANVFVCRKTKGGDGFVDKITETFKKAEKATPSIVFLDDLDKFANEDDRHCDADEYVAVQACIDDLRGKEVFVIATVNDTCKLPWSLRRHGRFDRQISVPLPTRSDAKQIIQHYLEKKKLTAEVDIELIAAMLQGNSCATLETVINEAGLIAGYQREEMITQDHIVEACMRCVFNVPAECVKEGQAINCSTQNLESLIVWHEAGHAVVRDVLDEGSVALVSARCQKGSHSGFTISGSDRSGDPLRRYKESVMVRLGGKAATEVQFGFCDVGAREDLEKAYQMVHDAVGNLAYAGFHFFECGYSHRSDRLYENTESVVAAYLEEYYQRTKALLIANREYLEKLAAELAEKGVLVSTDIARIRAHCTIVPVSI